MTLLTVSSLEAAYELSDHLLRTPDVSIEHGITQLRHGPSDTARLDYESGSRLLEKCGTEPFATSNRTSEGRRAIVKTLISAEEPIWRLAAVRGREWCRRAMDPDTDQALGWAGLWDVNPSSEVVAWWQELAVSIAGIANAARLEAGRTGETLTLEFERGRLRSKGIEREPIWRGFEDNSLGYDVESWMHAPTGEIVPFRIEVKAHGTPLPRFFLSRNEWETALRFQDSYAIDVWDLSRRALTRLHVSDLLPAMPSEKPAARWQEILVFPNLF